MRLGYCGFGLAAIAIVMPAQLVSKVRLDQWGLTPQEWLDLDGPAFRARIDVIERRAEIERRAAAGEVDAMTIAAGALTDTIWGAPNYALALHYATRAAEAGSPRAMVSLGGLLTRGVDGPPDPQRAYYWFSRAADAGVVVALMQKGVALANGAGVAKDPAAAVALYRQASERQLPAADYMLAWAYAQGTGVTKDLGTALSLMRRAAEAGHGEAMLYYGSWLGDADVVATPDPAASTQWVVRAAEKGVVEAMYFSGQRLRNGFGVAKNPAEAARWYERAAEAGNAQARFQLAFMLVNPQSGIAQDRQRATRLYRQVAEDRTAPAGYVPDAWYNLGVIAQQQGDFALARTLYVEADRQGSPSAKASIGVLDAFAERQARAAEERRIAARQAQAEAERQAAARAVADKLAAAKAKAGAVGAPTINEVLDVLARSSARYVGGQATSTPGEVAFESMFGGIQHYERRYVSNLGCTKLKAASYRCDFDMRKETVGADDSFWGQAIALGGQMVGSRSYHWSNVFTRTASGGWSSGDLDQENIAYARASSQAASQQSSSSSPPCEIRGGMAPVMSGGMIGGVTWDSSIRRPC